MDGPARISRDGTKRWYKYGNLHRLDGPALIQDGVRKVWFINNKMHRIDGPAHCWYDHESGEYTKSVEYYIDGNIYTEYEFDKITSSMFFKVKWFFKNLIDRLWKR